MKRAICVILLGFFVSLTPSFVSGVFAQDGYQTPPAVLAALVDAPATPGVSVSPDDSRLLLMTPRTLPSISDLAQPELRLAGRRINPRNNGPSRARYYTSLSIAGITGAGTHSISGIPEDAKISNISWSPDGAYISFAVATDSSIDLYLADASSGSARKLIDRGLNVALGGSVVWMPNSRQLLVRTISPTRGDAPEEPAVPSSPVVQENMGKVAPARTYQDLLSNPYEADLFSYLVESEVLLVSVDGSFDVFYSGLITRTSPSPDGQYVLTETMHRPFSYLVPSRRFPSRVEVRRLDGTLVAEMVDRPLEEEIPTGIGSVATGMRFISWRPDVDATLYWTEAQDGGDARAEADLRDAVFMQSAPFVADPIRIADLPLRYAGISWSTDGFAFVNESWWASRSARVYQISPDHPADGQKVVFDFSYEDRYNNPGSPMMKMTPSGTRVIQTADNGTAIFLTGTGASPEGNRPFVRKMDLRTGEITELFRSQAPFYERVIGWVGEGEKVLLTSRESVSEPANFFLRNLESGSLEQVTHFPHPYPELDAIQKEFIVYEREDGVQLTATLYLPPGYSPASDGPLPAYVWAYPREFKDASAAGQISDSPYRFKRISYSGAIPFVTQGYAVINNASMPIIGEGDEEPNDTFVKQLVMNARAAIDEGVRRGVVDPDRVAIGGHSYGAFMTANLLAHSDLFRAGIARSGAYNRSLTPFGFQAEPRTFWEAPEVYFAMSPFMNANKVNEPILMIHGIADNNSGTFPIQSERFYHALKGMGKTARLVLLPHESHGYRARESVMHTIWETHRWLEMFVKNAPPREVALEKPLGGS